MKRNYNSTEAVSELDLARRRLDSEELSEFIRTRPDAWNIFLRLVRAKDSVETAIDMIQNPEKWTPIRITRGEE